MDVLVSALTEVGVAAAEVASLLLLSAWMAFVLALAAGAIAARRPRSLGRESAGQQLDASRLSPGGRS
jgi:hypothetical protein